MTYPQLHYCNNDAEWSRVVKSYSFEGKGICVWTGCTSAGIGAAHMFTRKIQALRFVIENGLWLCKKHHTELDSMSKAKKLALIKLLVGDIVYEALYRIYHASIYPVYGNPKPISPKVYDL
jgi:hypothetical protein